LSTIEVCCAADGSYIEHSAAMIHSLLACRGRYGMRIHYLHGDDLTEQSAQMLTEMVTSSGGIIDFLRFTDTAIAAIPPMEQSSPATWYRILLPELLPDVDRVLYLDIDTVAVDSLEPLWDTDLSGNLVAAVTNVMPPEALDRAAQLGLGAGYAYFNAGVLLLNLEEIRRSGTADELREHSLRHGGDLLWRDQDVLNLVLGKARVQLHPRWNSMNAMRAFPWARELFGAGELEEASLHPGIRHFEGPLTCKPWHYLCDDEMRQAYFDHRAATPWPTCSLQGATPRNKAKRALRELLRMEPARWDAERHAPEARWKRIGGLRRTLDRFETQR
jgi:lipopolysaccharide biosynthesis glycosyltransferase